MGEVANRRTVRLGSVAIGLALAYYLTARAGFALTPEPNTVSALWPPNAILLGTLLLTPATAWPMLLLAVLPAHVLAEASSGVPFVMILTWYITNCLEALIGAVGIRRLIEHPLRLDHVRDVEVFVVFGALVAPFLSSFVDAAFVRINNWGTAPYWDVWRIRFFSNVLAILAIVPVIVTWGDDRLDRRRLLTPRLALEGLLLVVSLIVVSTLIFAHPPSATYATPALLCIPMPFLLWAAVRFGPAGASTCLLGLTLLAVWGAVRRKGPFVGHSINEDILSLQLFLIVTFVPVLGLAAAIRERIRAEETARGSQARLNFALSAAHVGAWEWDTKDRAIWSPKSKEIFGLPGDDAPVDTAHFYSVIHPGDQTGVREAVDRGLEDDLPFELEYRIVRPDGVTRWVLTKGTMLREPSGQAPARMLGIHTDITERKLAEETLRNEAALRESEARLRELADAMPQIVFTAKPDGQLDYVNGKWYELSGIPPGGAFMNDMWLEALHPEDRASCRAAWQASVRDGVPLEHESRFRCARSGEYHWHLTRALPLHDESGNLRHWFGTATDIDAHRRAEDALRASEAKLRVLGEHLELRVADRTLELSRANEALRASEERFSKAFLASPDAIAIAHQPENRIFEMNERWEAMFRFTRPEAIGRTLEDLRLYAHQADADRVRELMALQGYVRELALDMRNRTGETLHATLAAETVQVGGEPCLILMFRDITERRRAEDEVVAQRRQLAHLGRVAVLGELSAALAHELNQPLTAILANARAAQRMLSRDRFDQTEIRAILDDIATDDLRAGAVISRVRALLRKGDSEPQLLVANEVVREVLELAHSDLIQRGVTVITSLGSQLPAIPADRVQLQQVVLNLIMNGCEAMADNPSTAERSLVISTAVEAGSVRISVGDRGSGIAGGSLDSVFEPFFTSKEHGLGLGLSICRSIVSAHGGRMWAVNNKDRGATFHVLLPMASPPSRARPVTTASSAAAPAGAGHR